MALVERALTTALATHDAPEPRAEVGRALARLTRGATVQTVADEVGYSRRRLSTVVREECGVTPKEYQRIARFSRKPRTARGARRRGSTLDRLRRCRQRVRRPGPPDPRVAVPGRLHAHDVAAHGVPIPSRPGRPVGSRLRRSPTKGPVMAAIGLWPTLSFRDADAMIAWLEAIGFTDPRRLSRRAGPLGRGARRDDCGRAAAGSCSAATARATT